MDFDEAYAAAYNDKRDAYRDGVHKSGWDEESPFRFVPYFQHVVEWQGQSFGKGSIDANTYDYWNIAWFILGFNPNFSYAYDAQDEHGTYTDVYKNSDIVQEIASDKVRAKKAVKIYLTAAAKRAKKIGSASYAAITKLLIDVEFGNGDAKTREADRLAALQQLWADNEVEMFANVETPNVKPQKKPVKKKRA